MPDVEIARLTDRLMRRIHASLNAKAATFDRHRIGPAGGIVLLTLADHEPARIQDLVRLMARDKSQMTRSVQALESKGLIERRTSPDDGRVSLLALTPEGHSTLKALQHAMAEVLADILSPLQSEDRSKLKEILRRI